MELKELKNIIDTMFKHLTIDGPTSHSFKVAVRNALETWLELSHAGGMFNYDTYARLSHYIGRKMNDYLSE